MRQLLLAALVVAALPAPAQTPAANPVADPVARGDEAWQRRAEGARDDLADPGPIGAAVAAYEEALEIDGADLEARWKLMRALYFQGEHTALDRDEQLAVHERGREIGEEGLDLLAEPLGGRDALAEMTDEQLAAAFADEPAAAPMFFWTGVHWGLWGRARGKLAAARQGVAGKIRDRAQATIAIDPRYEKAGGHRILGRLHDEAPKLPFFTGWIDRGTAVEQLELAVEIAPVDKLNRLYLAEALWNHRKARRDEALEMLRQLVDEEPLPSGPVEDARALADARALLERIG